MPSLYHKSSTKSTLQEMKSITSSLAFASAIFTLTLSLSACTKTPLNQPPLGPISATGTLIPAEVSLLRRGSYLFLINGKQMYYVESKTENLVQTEGQTVHIEGIAEANTSKGDLPVLIISKLTSVKGESGLRVWNIPALDIQLQAPSTWKASIQKNVATFLLPREEIPLLVINVSESDSLPVGGSHYYLSGHRAVRIDAQEGSSKSDVFVQGKEFILHLHFDATKQQSIERMEDAKLLESEFEFIVNSLKFLSDKRDTNSGSGSGLSVPCGGEGNVLCPQGSFCDVFDPALRIGKCRAIQS